MANQVYYHMSDINSWPQNPQPPTSHAMNYLQRFRFLLRRLKLHSRGHSRDYKLSAHLHDALDTIRRAVDRDIQGGDRLDVT